MRVPEPTLVAADVVLVTEKEVVSVTHLRQIMIEELRPVRCMNLCPHLRPMLVLQRVW